MTPYHSDPWLTVYQGDCREVMASMEPESVHCVVTSPPYWGLRDYGTATWIGGDEGCRHEGDGPAVGNNINVRGKDETAMPVGGWDKATTEGNQYRAVPMGGACRKCGAVRQDSQLGLEPTPEEYVANMVAVFREVRRVLRADGTVWLNLGDSYAANQTGNQPNQVAAGTKSGIEAKMPNAWSGSTQTPVKHPFKQKDLVGIPWMVAFALRADGWYLRSDIIWSKPNPMPESVTDRPTKAHEYLFLLSKNARYFFDADAVREPAAPESEARYGRGFKDGTGYHDGNSDPKGGGFRGAGGFADTTINPAGRNLRSVWSIATQPYPGAHFATFPEALVEPCVKAGTSERGVCPDCGAPWVREVEREVRPEAVAAERATPRNDGNRWRTADGGVAPRGGYKDATTGWRPSCDHGTMAQHITHSVPVVPATVLDPFAGSGTTGRVAQRLGRRAVLIDLSGEYLTQAMRRNQDIPLGLEA